MADKKLPLDDLLPPGSVGDFGREYFANLPDVKQDPLTPDSFLRESDHSWSEYAMAYLLWYPGIVILLALAGGMGVWMFFRFSRTREYAHRLPCGHCGTMMYPCALNCPYCGTPNPHPAKLNIIGYSKIGTSIPSDGRERHANVLRSFRRCANCGEILTKPTLNQICLSCGTPVLSCNSLVQGYDQFVSQRRYWTYPIVFLVSFVPILGPLLVSSLYKRTIVNPYSLYMTLLKDSSLMMLLFVCRHLFRLLPIVGNFLMPFLCVTEYTIYRKAFLLKAEKRGGRMTDEDVNSCAPENAGGIGIG